MEGKTKIIVAYAVTLTLSAMAFITGGLVYLCYRSRSLRMFEWADRISAEAMVERLRSFAAIHPCDSDFVLFSLPDGLWVLSYVYLMSTVWKFDLHGHFLMISLIPLIAVISECSQAGGFFPGTFDIKDLTAYILSYAIGTGHCIFIKRKILNNN